MKLRILVILLLFAAVSSACAAEKEITICAVGDVNFGGRLHYVGQQNGLAYFFKQVKPLLSTADLTVANLECALSDRGSPVPGKKFTFRGSPEAVAVLRWTGIDAVSVANNHARDFGEVAFLDTLEHLNTGGVVYVGGGRGAAEAYEHRIVKASGKNIALLAFCDILPGGWAAADSRPGVASARNTVRMLEAVRRARKEADLVIVSVHWGIEYDYRPTERQKNLAHALVDAGADLVVGHHPHVVQPLEFYRGALIAYSLGNFVFSPGGSPGLFSCILKVGYCGRAVSEIEIVPVVLSNGQPAPVSSGSSWKGKIRQIMALENFKASEQGYLWENSIFTNKMFLHKFFTLEGISI